MPEDVLRGFRPGAATIQAIIVGPFCFLGKMGNRKAVPPPDAWLLIFLAVPFVTKYIYQVH